MSSGHEKRRLAGVAADVACSFRLIGTGKEGALAQVKRLGKTRSNPKTTDHRWLIVKRSGDGAALEFGSIVDAAPAALSKAGCAKGVLHSGNFSRRVEAASCDSFQRKGRPLRKGA